MRKTLILTVTALTFAMPALAQNANMADMQQQLQKALGKTKNKDSMGQALAVGMLLGCTNKKVGKEATQAYYNEIQTIGKTVEGYCKQGNATEARALVLATLDAKHNDPVTESAIGCYDEQSTSIDSMAGPKMAADVAHYARWARDPALARTEMKTTDICH